MFISSGLIAAVAVAGAMATGVAQAETWLFALEEIDGSIQDIYAEAFKKRIEQVVSKRSFGWHTAHQAS